MEPAGAHAHRAPKRLTIVRGEGAWLTTSTGQRLLDGTAGLWHANIGHGRERWPAPPTSRCKLETYHTFGRFANEPALAWPTVWSLSAPVPAPR